MTARIPAFRRLMFMLLMSWMAESMAHAASPGEDEPIRIDARSVEANDKTGAMVYSGNVVVEQGRLSIRADRVEIMARQGRRSGSLVTSRSRSQTSRSSPCSWSLSGIS